MTGERYKEIPNRTIKERLATLEDGHWILIAAPTIEHMMTGTTRVGVMKDGTVKVEYEDGTIKERLGNDALLGTIDPVHAGWLRTRIIR